MLYVTSTEINIEKKKSNSSFRDEKFPCFRGWEEKKTNTPDFSLM